MGLLIYGLSISLVILTFKFAYCPFITSNTPRGNQFLTARFYLTARASTDGQTDGQTDRRTDGRTI